MAIDPIEVTEAVASGAIAVEQIADWIAHSSTLADLGKLAESLVAAFRRHGVDPPFGSKAVSDAAVMGAELAGDVAEDARFPPVDPGTLKSGGK